MTGDDIVDNARIIVNDVAASTWADADFLVFVNEGVRYVFDNAPHSRLQTDGTLSVYAKAAALSDTLLIEDEYLLPLTEYVCYRYFSSDSGDAIDKERANAHYGKFLAFFAPV